MSNIYTRKDGLKVMEVEYGWGMDMEAIEFPIKLATYGKTICEYLMLKGGKFLLNKVNQPELLGVYAYCEETIESFNKGEINYILSEFWREAVENINKYSKIYEKLQQ